MQQEKIFSADRIFTGSSWLRDHVIIVKDGVIIKLLPVNEAGSARINHLGHMIVPAFIDLQIYGAADKLLAVFPEADTIQAIYEYSRSGGAAYCLPTVATNDPEIFLKSIDAVRAYWESGGKGVPGLHIEGPWINPVKRGAHVEKYIHPPTMDEVRELLSYGEGVIRMITLAPEVCSSEIRRFIVEKGIIVSAGHSNASYSEAIESFNTGIRCVTHLYNAMSPLLHRAPGLVGATMDHENVMASIIPDGFHSDFAAVRIAKKAMGERLFVITDAVTETKSGNYQHILKGDRYEANGILSGSALTMIKAVRNLVQYAGIDKDEALKMCALYPAKALGVDHISGRIAEGYEAKLLVLDPELNVVDVID